uniref:Uncharacterized protein n=1 Tax=Rhizophora mucronata TaxID=61149 RepID=A0A2P2QL91_RHIMU
MNYQQSMGENNINVEKKSTALMGTKECLTKKLQLNFTSMHHVPMQATD